MRTLLIVLLLLSLAAAALATRPGKRDFVFHLLDGRTTGDAAWTTAEVERAVHIAQSLEFKNRWLWTDVVRDGKVIYSGAFSHWLSRGGDAQKELANVPDVARSLAQN